MSTLAVQPNSAPRSGLAVLRDVVESNESRRLYVAGRTETRVRPASRALHVVCRESCEIR